MYVTYVVNEEDKVAALLEAVAFEAGLLSVVDDFEITQQYVSFAVYAGEDERTYDKAVAELNKALKTFLVLCKKYGVSIAKGVRM